MKILKHPFHLLLIAVGAISIAVVLWRVEPTGQHVAAYVGGLVALWAAVDLARRLGLEPAGDPARGRQDNAGKAE